MTTPEELHYQQKYVKYREKYRRRLQQQTELEGGKEGDHCIFSCEGDLVCDHKAPLVGDTSGFGGNTSGPIGRCVTRAEKASRNSCIIS